MAGSNKWFNYQADDATNWAIFADEGNVEAANDVSAVPPVAGSKYKPPRNMRIRYAVFANESGDRSISIPITTIAAYNALNSSSSITDPLPGGGGSGNLLAFIRKRPEIISPSPTVFDTGLDDGDQP